MGYDITDIKWPPLFNNGVNPSKPDDLRVSYPNTVFSTVNNSTNYFGFDFFNFIFILQLQAINMAYMKSVKNLKAGERMQAGAPPPHRAKLTKLSPECDKKIDAISQRLNCDPNDLKAVIYAESGGDPKAVNKSGATGLIQFMPSTAKDLGTSTGAIAKMSTEEQLFYVEKYLQRAKIQQAKFAPDHKLTAGELYALVFMPAKAKQEVMCSAGSKAYRQNRGLDRSNNHDGQITQGDLATKMARIKETLGFFA
jgi:hypothetical protein